MISARILRRTSPFVVHIALVVSPEIVICICRPTHLLGNQSVTCLLWEDVYLGHRLVIVSDTVVGLHRCPLVASGVVRRHVIVRRLFFSLCHL